MSNDERLQLCDREFLFTYYVKSPVRYACQHIFSKIATPTIIPVHESFAVDIFDRPQGGVMFPSGEVLHEGSLWTLSEAGEYLFLRVSSPLEVFGALEAIISINRGRVKVFVDTPWTGQESFASAWNLLFRIVFHASLDHLKEQFVRGLGILVDEHGVLVNTSRGDLPKDLVAILAGRFPTLGHNRLLLRREKDGFHLYATPWTQPGYVNYNANIMLKLLVLVRPKTDADKGELSKKQFLTHFISKQGDELQKQVQDSVLFLDDLAVVELAYFSSDRLIGELEAISVR
ncbi:hypothetical protein JXM67_08590 [candidate division WOR-3 bacterium]|nr:hypothetical protein [candidate division WOR-3 bacterium]